MKWKYKIYKFDLEDQRLKDGSVYPDITKAESKLNELGAEGWELVSTAPISYSSPIGDIVTTEVTFIFRKPIE